MKKVFLSLNLSLLTLVVATSCTRPASEVSDATTPGTTGTTVDPAPRTVSKPVAGEDEHTFSLSVPFESVALVQGGNVSVRIGINRGANFGEQVEVALTGLPQGVTVQAQDSVITPGSTGIDLILMAADDAALGEFTAKVTGHTSSSGADFSEEIKLTVSQE